jgi:hypothetical protein
MFEEIDNERNNKLRKGINGEFIFRCSYLSLKNKRKFFRKKEVDIFGWYFEYRLLAEINENYSDEIVNYYNFVRAADFSTASEISSVTEVGDSTSEGQRQVNSSNFRSLFAFYHDENLPTLNYKSGRFNPFVTIVKKESKFNYKILYKNLSILMKCDLFSLKNNITIKFKLKTCVLIVACGNLGWDGDNGEIYFGYVYEMCHRISESKSSIEELKWIMKFIEKNETSPNRRIQFSAMISALFVYFNLYNFRQYFYNNIIKFLDMKVLTKENKFSQRNWINFHSNLKGIYWLMNQIFCSDFKKILLKLKKKRRN